jgi:hypothetical protein
MNDELQEVLAQILKRSMEVAEQTGVWAMEMAPELIQQFLLIEIINSVIGLTVGILLITVWIVIKNWMKRQEDEESIMDFDVDVLAAFFGASLFTLLPSLIMVSIHIHKILHILLAPELYLIKYFL